MHEVDRPIKERTKAEIESKISEMGDYVKMSYLQRALKSGLDFETKKFVLLKLAGSYESRKMHLEAGKMMRIAAEINKTFKDKRLDFMKAVNSFVKGSEFAEADRIFAQALTLGNQKEKIDMKSQYKDYYLKIAGENLRNGRRNQAKQFYEKAITLDLEPGERTEIQKNLLDIYEKLGKIKDYMDLKKSL